MSDKAPIFSEEIIRSGEMHLSGVEMNFVMAEDHIKLENKLTAISDKLDELTKEYEDAYDCEGYINHQTRKVYKIILKDLKQIKELL